MRRPERWAMATPFPSRHRLFALFFAGLLVLSLYGTMAPASARCSLPGRVGCVGGFLGPSSGPQASSGDQWFNVVLYDYGFWITNTVSGANESQNWTVFENYDVHINATSEPPNAALGGTGAHGIGLVWTGSAPDFDLITSVGAWVNGSFVAPNTASYHDRVYCTNPCGTGHAGMTVNILNIVPVTSTPTVNVTATPSSGYAPLSVGLHRAVSGGTPPYLYSWDFGDRNGSTVSTNLTHLYTTVGTFHVRLSVLDQNGLTGSGGTTVDVIPTPTFTVVANGTPDQGLAPLPVTFTATASGGVGPYQYSWTFGDGGVGVGAAVTHTYENGGAFYAVVSVRDARGFTSGASVPIQVRSTTPSPLRLIVSLVPTSGDLPFEVNSTASISGGEGTIGNVTWDFGDGSPRVSGPRANHTYDRVDPGTLNVTALVSDSLGELAYDQVKVAVFPAPSASLGVRLSRLVTPATATFSLRLSGGNGTFGNVMWDFGDGTTGNGTASRTHDYPLPGSFPVTVTGLDSTGHRVTAFAWVNLSANSTSGTNVHLAPSTRIDNGPLVFLGVVGATGLALVIAAGRRESRDPVRLPPRGAP